MKIRFERMIYMYCEDCGKRITDESHFCKFCGMPVMDMLESNNYHPAMTGTTMRCDNCGIKILEGSKFCHKCGNRVRMNNRSRICYACGRRIETDSTFCNMCGSKQPL